MIHRATLNHHDADARRLLDRLWAMHYIPGRPAYMERLAADDAVAAYGRFIYELAVGVVETIYERSALLAEYRLDELASVAHRAVDRATAALERDMAAAARERARAAAA